MRFALPVLAALSLAFPWSASAGDWTDVVFPERTFDFGTVAKGSKVRHSFQVVNSTKQEVHITSWNPKCGCTDVKVGARDIPPGTQTVIEVVIDTTNFENNKSSGVVVFFDRPTVASVDLGITCFIRTDIRLNPGQVDFGVVNRSKGSELKLALTYSGSQPGWEITGMRTISDHVVAELKEQGRSPGGQISYVLTATLKPSAPVGIFKDEITIKTNDPSNLSIPVSVSAVVQSNVVVSPSVINFGTVKAGSTITRTVLVRSSQPFQLTDIKPGQPDLALPPPAAGAPKGLHSMVLTFKVPAKLGPYHASVEFETDVKDEPPAQLTAFANIVP